MQHIVQHVVCCVAYYDCVTVNMQHIVQHVVLLWSVQHIVQHVV